MYLKKKTKLKREHHLTGDWAWDDQALALISCAALKYKLAHRGMWQCVWSSRETGKDYSED